jgi:reverse gyrase
MIIRKVNALAGAGKTFAAVHYADRNARIGHKYALVQPTQDLIDETVKEIRKLNPAYSVTAIHGGTSDSVIRDIVDHTRTARSHEGDILLMTHAAFQRLPYWHHRAACCMDIVKANQQVKMRKTRI